MINLLAGIALAAFLFAALLWSGYRATVTNGHKQLIALLLSVMTLFGMASVSFLSIFPSKFAGGSLVVLGAFAIWYDPRWSKLLPLVQVLFGVALILGLPWMTA